jgi:drug/metabolite transporter (DMT)-like permease
LTSGRVPEAEPPDNIAEIEAGVPPAPAPDPVVSAKTAHSWRDYALLLMLACCWSSTYPLTKIGLGSIPPITFISARSLTAALFLTIILTLRGIRIPTDKKAWKLFAFQQTINSTIPFLMITWAQQYVPASSTVVLASTTPIFAFVITWAITRHEPATLAKLAGAVLGLAGTAVIIGLDALSGLGHDIFAECLILLATVSFACATIFGLRLSDYDPMVVAAGSLLFGGTLLLPVSLIVDHPWTLHPTREALIATIGMGIFSSALGLMLFYMCLMRLGTLITNAQGYLRIPIGVGLSVVLLGETVPPNLVLGLVLVMAGVGAMTVPDSAYRNRINWLRARLKGPGPAAGG